MIIDKYIQEIESLLNNALERESPNIWYTKVLTDNWNKIKELLYLHRENLVKITIKIEGVEIA